MVDPAMAGGTRPSMFVAGNSVDAKTEAATLTESLGWGVEDMGTATAARAIDPLCMLWCIPGPRGGSWSHAFKLSQLMRAGVTFLAALALLAAGLVVVGRSTPDLLRPIGLAVGLLILLAAALFVDTRRYRSDLPPTRGRSG
jgi:hypothetical protein